jgi:histidinol dehydrogenase
MKNQIPPACIAWNPECPDPGLLAFLSAPPVDPAAERTAARVLDAVRTGGDVAVSRYVRQFDGAVLPPGRFRIPEEELVSAGHAVSKEFRRGARFALGQIRRFAAHGRRPDWMAPLPAGGRAGERFLPLQRVGLYIPGGAAPLASTVLMTAGFARAAGVPEIVACTPCDASGAVDPHILFALRLAGVTEAYRIGGIQAIAAMAYGTPTLRAVDKIAGPGGPYVTAAKRLVYGITGVDMVAGPSEIAILADASAPAAWIAEDVLSQAEHGTGMERTLLVSTSAPLARRVREILQKRAAEHPRGDCVRQVLSRRTRLAVCKNLADATDLINRFAPEHLEILVRSPRKLLPGIRNAGAVFLGPWTPESAGDFAIGPSHVLPTGGSARFFSGLTVEDFRRRTSVMELTRPGLKALLPAIRAFSRVERLPSHGRAAEIRFER